MSIILHQHRLNSSPRGHSQRTSSWPRGRGGLRNPGVQLLFECDYIVLSRRRGGLEILVLVGRPLWMAPYRLYSILDIVICLDKYKLSVLELLTAFKIWVLLLLQHIEIRRCNCRCQSCSVNFCINLPQYIVPLQARPNSLKQSCLLLFMAIYGYSLLKKASWHWNTDLIVTRMQGLAAIEIIFTMTYYGWDRMSFNN